MAQVNSDVSPDNNIILKVSNLSAGYGKRQVLFNVSLEVKYGEIVLLMGGNGSGKSTLLKAIYGLVRKWNKPEYTQNAGTLIQFMSDDITNAKPYELINKELAYVPHKNNSFDQLSVRENLEVAATHLQNKAEREKRINRIYEKLPQLATIKNRTPFHLSGGEKQLLALGMALMPQPKMILLDEPGAGLSPKAWQKNLDTIKTLNHQGITFLIVEHRVKETISHTHNVLQMKLGKFVTS